MNVHCNIHSLWEEWIGGGCVGLLLVCHIIILIFRPEDRSSEKPKLDIKRKKKVLHSTDDACVSMNVLGKLKSFLMTPNGHFLTHMSWLS